MSDEDYEEVTTESHGQRLGKSLKNVNVVAGFGLVIGAFVLLFWNEGRTVERYKTLREGENVVVSVKSDKVDPAMNNRLIHTTGKADTTVVLTDRILGVSSMALVLERTSEMYQWIQKHERETRHRKGDKPLFYYSYSQDWSSSFHDSSNFKRETGHENPSSMPIESETFINENVSLGAFKLTKELAKDMTKLTPLMPKNTNNVVPHFKDMSSVEGDKIYLPNQEARKYRIE